MPKEKTKNALHIRKNNRGQFLILSALSIILVMISLASLLAYSSVSKVSLSMTNFREITAEIALNFRGAVAAALAEVSNELDHHASVTRYAHYTTLDEYSDAEVFGHRFLAAWYNKTVIGDPESGIPGRYSGLGLNLSISPPYFECDWSSNPGYSLGSSNVSLDILAYGFYGWKSKFDVQLNLTILDLDAGRSDGKTITFYFFLEKEDDFPVTGISEGGVSVYYKHVGSNEFSQSKSVILSYLGNGYYLTKFSMYSTTVHEGLNEIYERADDLGEEDYVVGYNYTMLRQRINEVNDSYNSRRLVEAYWGLTECRYWINVTVSDEGEGGTTTMISWIDLVRSQILPTVRVTVQDSRGIVVSAARTFEEPRTDRNGPVARNPSASPNPTEGANTVKLTAWIDDLSTGLSNITDAEYFIGTIGESGSGARLQASDGSFDSMQEKVETTIDVSGWTLGSQTIYIHGKDSSGNWGGFATLTINVTEPIEMYVLDITYDLPPRGAPRIIVTIVDVLGNPVQGARVSAYWTYRKENIDDYAFTDNNGMAMFYRPRGGGQLVSFTVVNVDASGYIYNPDLNIETTYYF